MTQYIGNSGGRQKQLVKEKRGGKERETDREMERYEEKKNRVREQTVSINYMIGKCLQVRLREQSLECKSSYIIVISV